MTDSRISEATSSAVKVMVVDTCYKKDSLSSDEFVRPIVQIIRNSGIKDVDVKHFTEMTDTAGLDAYSHIVICGNALMDDEYLNKIEFFRWIKSFNGRILGICAGMQMIAAVFGSVPLEHLRIGMNSVEIVGEDSVLCNKSFECYELHSKAAVTPEDFIRLAGMKDYTQAFKSRDCMIYGIIFHPEVRNQWIIHNFFS
ncbi:hypothetical protein JW868_00605 [Candidatus Woesearchaeota archaeon]|nr:hypothetical protein [Candidatus Woesearchaeota archaeon]